MRAVERIDGHPAVWLGVLVCIAGLVVACGDEGGTTGDGDAGDGADAGADASSDSANETDFELPAVVSCEPEPGRCDAFTDLRPSRLSEHAAAYDPENRQMIVFGGSSAVPNRCDIPAPAFVDETWLYDEPCNAWRRIDGTSPGARVRHMMAYGDGVVWLFGGRFRDGNAGPYTLYNDVWRFNTTTRQWDEVAITGELPEARVNGVLVWDSRRGHLWLFGGNVSQSGAAYVPRRDVWELDPIAGAWTPHTISGTQPDDRLFHAGWYDPRRDALVIFGGGDETAFDFTRPVSYMRDLWSLDLATLAWTELHSGASGGPDGRFWPGGAYDVVDDRYIVFAGHDDGTLAPRNDTWEFDPNQSSWTPTTPEDTLNNPGGGDFCTLPPDFTNVAIDVPERRNSHTMVWSSCGVALSFAGKTDCGAIDDVWAYADGEWEERLAATVGENCNRWRNNPANCVNICF